MDLLKKIKQAELTGRGGACFPTAKKWEMVKKASGKQKYVVCNASEGEPGVKKDEYILKNFPEKVIEGMALAMRYLSEKSVDVKGCIYINPDYYDRLAPRLLRIIGERDIEVFVKPHYAGYVGGEETAVLNSIEGKRIEPRLKPPYPTTQGLWREPTIVNNVETLYDICLIYEDQYERKRFYTLGGKIKNKGVFVFNENITIEKILKETNNYPDFDFFVQVGGNGSGGVLNSKQLRRQATGAGSITVYKLKDHKKVLQNWINFFLNESCGKCTSCREGVYRLNEVLKEEKVNWHLFSELIDNLKETAFCGVGCAVPIPITSYIKNVLNSELGEKINISEGERKLICECFN